MLTIQLSKHQLMSLLAAGAVCCAYAEAGRMISAFFDLPLSGALVGMLMLLVTLFIWRDFAIWMTRSSAFFLKHMIVFFVPAVLSAVHYQTLFRQHWISLTFAIVITTAFSMLICGYLAQRLFKKQDHNDTDEAG